MVDFKCGFVNVIGMPNAGKSSLVNSITGVATSIVTHKPQTTRERVFAIHNIDGYQIIFLIVLDILKMRITSCITI